MKKEIFKVQLAFNNDNVLVYNQDRSSIGEFQIDSALKKFAKGRKKFFVYAKPHNKKGPIEILGEAPWQDW